MKKVQNRAISALLIAFLIIAGMCVYIVRYAQSGKDWADFSVSVGTSGQGKVIAGTVTDRNGTLLAHAENSEHSYSDDDLIRISTLHTVGDFEGNIGTGVLRVFSDTLSGYNPITGITGEPETITLTIDADICAVAYQALAGRAGAVLVSDYTTGEIICMVSTPGYDPLTGFDENDPAYGGAYLNRAISSSFTPGSVFKLVTVAAALETIPDIFEKRFECSGSMIVDGAKIVCTGVHGQQTIEQALANSCNCAFAQLGLELGGKTLEEYARALGMTDSHSLSGIDTKRGSFEAAADGSAALAWSAIGQSTNLVCPYSMLRLCAAIANGGVAVEGSIILGDTGKTSTLLSPDTAQTLKEMMNYNVQYSYGTWNFPGLNICAKSGTAEVGDGSSHAWFTGFLDDAEHPYAFTVFIEGGGGGLRNAGTVANTVLQAIVNNTTE